MHFLVCGMTHLFKAFPSTIPGANISRMRSLNLHHAHVYLLSPPYVIRGAGRRKVTTVAVIFPEPMITLPCVGTTPCPHRCC